MIADRRIKSNHLFVHFLQFAHNLWDKNFVSFDSGNTELRKVKKQVLSFFSS